MHDDCFRMKLRVAYMLFAMPQRAVMLYSFYVFLIEFSRLTKETKI